ncbi:hypothetical protein [Dysosmobacter sp. Phy]
MEEYAPLHAVQLSGGAQPLSGNACSDNRKTGKYIKSFFISGKKQGLHRILLGF